MQLMLIAVLIAVAVIVAGCGPETKVIPSFTTFVEAEPPRYPDECTDSDPAEPKLAEDRDATALDLVKHIEERKKDRRALVGKRKVCREAIRATQPAKKKAPATS